MTVSVGSLLVARPRLVDGHFRRSVVYVLAHGADGTVGVVINRRSESTVTEVLPQWAPCVTKPAVVYLGGPVQRDAAMAIAVERSAGATVEPGAGLWRDAGADTPPGVSGSPAFQRVLGPVVMVHLDADPAVVGPQVRGLRIFVGHAGWGAGQLADEIDEGAWTVLPALPDDLLAGPMVDLWFRVLRRQGWPAALAAYAPSDLRSN